MKKEIHYLPQDARWFYLLRFEILHDLSMFTVLLCLIFVWLLIFNKLYLFLKYLFRSKFNNKLRMAADPIAASILSSARNIDLIDSVKSDLKINKLSYRNFGDFLISFAKTSQDSNIFLKHVITWNKICIFNFTY